MKLLILGCGGHGRCCLEIAEAMNQYDEIAFLDDGHVGEVIQGRNVIGRICDIVVEAKNYDEVFIAIGNNHFRMQLIREIEKSKYPIATLIHPNTYISKHATIGKGTVVFPYACVESNTRIGKGCIVCANTVINHDVVVEDHCLIYANTTIRAEAVVKEETRIGSQCNIGFGKVVEEKSDVIDGMIV